MTPFKEYIGPDVVRGLAEDLVATGALDVEAFVASATDGLDTLELKARVTQVAAALRGHLDPDYRRALAHILRALPPVLRGTDGVTGGFGYWPYAHFIEAYGEAHFEASMKGMLEITQRFTAEFAVRPFLVRETERTLAWLRGQLDHPSHHVRRWISEGTRPRLPWGVRLNAFVADPGLTLPFLESLRDDPQAYVRRSVANHLNDVAKDHPDFVVEVAERWWEDGNETRRRLLRHALRGLVKQGHPGALAVLGYGPARAELVTFEASDAVTLGGSPLSLTVALRSTAKRSQPLLIDFAIHHRKANGQTAPKVFKWTQRELGPGETLTLTKQHAMRPITTRRYYPGRHAAELLVNGESLGRVDFELMVQS